ncbi:glutamate--cysteine ligase [Larsenimonas suaedae]|uniref:Glutamate--cysteine ligase n=1 Tax=Larsenimonas suaedae TaxID=1851019 RepID=A0ABU1GWF8_9GAMM|nr:glutamate--cysteine ligase [Larsenimonas suaedae]MDR5896381.1 glutamate--cysteine ligase [Larsenimonas suaedae]
MSESFQSQLDLLRSTARQGMFRRIRRGIEKEGLRVDHDGRISARFHPEGLGAKLTHPHITTDYSESLLEYITPVYCRPKDALAFLGDLHRYTYRYLDGEWVWPASMPSRLNGNDSVPIADYGSSNIGKMKQVYRRGLDLRYGRIMQSIAGIHYNFSLPDELWPVLQSMEGSEHLARSTYRSRRYFDLIRNFRRNSWLLLYLFGGSPAIDESFLDGRESALPRHGKRTRLSPFASSLRMSDLGYQNKVQDQLKICFNSLENYINTLRHAISAKWPAYEAKGVKDEQGQWRQLSTNILQIENEYYSDIRPKRVAKHNETPTQALEAGGVEYIEVRCLDLDPFDPLGISEDEIRFLDTFLVWCLLSPSPKVSDAECDQLDLNRARVVANGRDPDLTLLIEGREVSINAQMHALWPGLEQVAELLDEGDDAGSHQQALSRLKPRLDHPESTPAGRMYEELTARECEFTDWSVERAKMHAEHFMAEPMDRAREALFTQLSETSHSQQRDLDGEHEPSFDEFLGHYFEQASEPRVAKAD